MQFFRKIKILIVDDDQDLLVGLGIRLRAAGYQIAVAPDAGAAVRAVAECRPDLILLDLGLPGGDGLWMLRRFKNSPITQSIPVIVITAHDTARESKVMEEGASAFLQKPVDNSELLAAITFGLEHQAASALR
jgi:two-component system KDP operon response regulator KdpE